MATNSAPLRAGIDAARDYQDLPAWQKTLTLAEELYNSNFPSPELKALALDRALNIATRIAASSVRPSEPGIAAGYQEAQGSVAELATVLTIAARLGLENGSGFSEQLEEISRLLIAMRHGLKLKEKDEAYKERETTRRDSEHAERQERKPRREFKPRDGDDRPRREFKPRDGDDRPRREYKPRGEGEDRPRREYKPRDGGDDRPRREYKPRDDRDGERKPRRDFGDKKPYGDRKPYGDKKKPYGERKPYAGGDKKPYGGKPRGDKPFRKPRRDD